MRRELKTLAGALAVFLLAVGLVACGGGGDDSSSTSTEVTGQTTSESPSSPKQTGGEDKAPKQGQRERASSENDEAAEFVPKQHSDSGGGSARFKQKGGDNSVQEFGEETEGGEFEAAAATLHNYLDARAEQNWAATCGYVSETITESLEKLAAQAKKGEGLSCAGILGKLVNPGAVPQMKEEADQADVRSVRIEGDRGFVLYTGVEGDLMSMPMAKEDGSWKVASLAGVPLG